MKKNTIEFDTILNQQKELSSLALEVERVLRFYDEHPNYPLDIAKLREKVMELYSKVNKSITDLQKFQSDLHS